MKKRCCRTGEVGLLGGSTLDDTMPGQTPCGETTAGSNVRGGRTGEVGTIKLATVQVGTF